MSAELKNQLRDARARLLGLALDLDDAQWLGPRLPIVNPMRWELGHVAFFQEFWTLRHARGQPPLLPGGDALYDSAKVAHDTRWDLPLPSRADTLGYMAEVLERSLAALDDGRAPYFHQLALFHEDMHGEALAYTRQTLGYPAPPAERALPLREGSPHPGDAELAGGKLLLGATGEEPFVFDNEKWGHEVEVRPFRMAKAPVTNADFRVFVEEQGYARRALWSDEGWAWREAVGATHPVYWEREGEGFVLRRYDGRVPLPLHHPVIHVSWFEADAYCRWAKRRLPTEAEWELAAGGLAKRRFPWGDEEPTAEQANLDARAGWTVPVSMHAAGDSPEGVRQLVGNTWEWTSSDFRPYPGFVADPYEEYSAPWFATPHKVLRGGCWATRGRLLRSTWRNFYPPHRRDVFAGFRTCARD